MQAVIEAIQVIVSIARDVSELATGILAIDDCNGYTAIGAYKLLGTSRAESLLDKVRGQRFGGLTAKNKT